MNTPDGANWLAILNAGWFGLIVGLVLSVVGILFGYVLYRRAKQVTRLKYCFGDAALIGPTPTSYSEGLEIRFDGQVVPLVTSTSFGIWNGGNTTIDANNIVASDPLQLELKGDATILRATVEASNRSVNGAKILAQNWQSVRFTFDYLDPGDGFRLQIIHSGVPGSVSSRGTLRGLPQGLEEFDPSKSFFLFMRLFAIFMFIIAIPLVGVFIYMLGHSVLYGPTWKKIPIVLALLVSSVLIYVVRRWAEKGGSPPRIKGVPKAITDDPTLFNWPSSELRGPYS